MTERWCLARSRAAVSPASPAPTMTTSALRRERAETGVTGSAAAAAPAAAVPISLRRVMRASVLLAANQTGPQRRLVYRGADGDEPLFHGGVLRRPASRPRRR